MLQSKEIPVFIFTGFLDSGKTTLVKETLRSDDFAAERTLLIVCEEGEEEFDPDFLKLCGAMMVTVDESEELTDRFLLNCAKRYDPDQVMIEYNGLWKMEQILARKLPRYWAFCGIYSTVDTTTAEMYLTNMRMMFLEPLSQSGLVIFNRCTDEHDRAKLRRAVRINNPAAQIVFERDDGEVYDPADEPLPFDLSGPVVDISDIDYGIWYLDAQEHPENYKGKSVRFLAQVYKGRNLKAGTFVPGRFVMTCCIEDVQFLGYMCRYEGNLPYKMRDWVRVTADFGYEYIKSYGDKAPILKLKEIEPAKKPALDPVYFQ